MKRKRLGQACVFCSALVFGFTPIIAAISYRGGNNGINMAFLRALLPIPLLLFLGRHYPWPNAKQMKTGLLAGCLSFGCTLLLYSSYEYISPGLATTLHFLYPLYVTVFEAVRSKKLPGPFRLLGLAMALGGSLLFLEKGEMTGSTVGFVLAIVSGMVYAVYIMVLGREAADPLPLPRLMLLVSCSGVVLCGILALCTGKLNFAMPTLSWVCAVAVALLSSTVGGTLFQKGVREVGETDAAVFSLFEPLTSVLFSILLLGDQITPKRILGCCLILGGLFISSVLAKPVQKSEG